MSAPDPIAKFRSRKLGVALLLEGLATGLLIAGFVDQSIWRDVTLVVAAGYLAANAYQNVRT